MEGSELELNFSSSAAGSIRVEIRDRSENPIPDFRLQDCDDLFGNQLDRMVTWRRAHSDVPTEDQKEILNKPFDLSRALEERVVRLRFAMKAADLCSIRLR